MGNIGGKKLSHYFIMVKKITGKQLRMARVSLKWRVDDLAKISELPWARIQTLERSDDFLENNETSQKLIKVFKEQKIEFVEETDSYYSTLSFKK
jgi:hypothetical protein